MVIKYEWEKFATVVQFVIKTTKITTHQCQLSALPDKKPKKKPEKRRKKIK